MVSRRGTRAVFFVARLPHCGYCRGLNPALPIALLCAKERPMAASPSADRNLLFGILALQMDFISRDQLVAAMHAWVLDKQKPLGQVLLDQKALEASRHALLDALVQEHLKQHDNDPQKSLAAVSSIKSVREEL